jgi:hypothetical protein
MTNQIQPRSDRRSRSDTIARSPRGETRHWQIGPRIRVGGTLGNIGQQAKIGLGKVASNPFVDGALGFIPGVGPGLSAAANMAGRALDTSNGGLHGMDGVMSLVKGGATGYAAGMAGNAIRGAAGKALSAGMGAFGGHGGSADGSVAPTQDQIDADPYGDGNPSGAGLDANGMPLPGGSGGQSLLDRLKGLVGGAGKAFAGAAGGGKGGILDTLLAGAGVASQAKDRARMQGVQNDAINYAKSGYDEKAPLRARALAQLSSDQPTSDLSSIFSNPGNPYDNQKRGLPQRMTGPSAASLLTSGQSMTNTLGNRVPAPPQAQTPTSAVG